MTDPRCLSCFLSGSLALWLSFAVADSLAMGGDEQAVYSGPQAGEALGEFTVRQILGVDQPTEIDPVQDAEENPLLIVFLHEVNRPVIAMTRALTRYAQTREKDGLSTAVVLLSEDVSGGEMMLKRVQHALTPGVVTGVSIDGRDGPGVLGLNRSVQMTILVAKSKKVSANFAIVQPSLSSDLPKIVTAIVEQVGGPTPKLDDLLDRADPERVRSLLRPLIQKDASDEQVDRSAEAVEKECEQDAAIRKEVGRIARTIVYSGKLENYGTDRAQSILRRWADTLGDPDGK
jgi:hypothetical protein